MRSCLLWAALAVAPSHALAQAAPPPAKPAAPAPKPAAVGEVVVSGQAPPVVTSIDRQSYSVANDLRATAGSISDALRNVPSLEVDVQGNVSLRGDSNVTILVDGKPSGLFRGENKGQALQQLPADRIERVEVITNPSAEFRADGTAGIINLVTKTAKGAGRTGSARASTDGGERLFASGNLGYNGKDVTVAADAFLRLDSQNQISSEARERLDPAAGALAGTRLNIDADSNLTVAGGRVSVDYDLSAATRVGAELRGQYFGGDLESLNHTEREDGRGALVGVFDRAITVDQDRGNGELTLNLRRKLDGDGHEFTLQGSYEVTEEDRTRAGTDMSRLPPLADAHDRQHVLTSLRQAQVKGDYTRPFEGGSKLKLGFDVQWDDNRYDNRGFRGPTAPAQVPDAALTNLFLLDQQLLQGYVTYERPIGDLTVLAGLRVEDVRIDLDQVTLGRKTENDYARLYPSLHLAWKLSDSQQLTASYSHRVQRPQPEEFNDFPFLIDPVTYRSGNPDLAPQETHSYEVGWQYRKNGFFHLATLYFRDNEKVVSEVTRDIGGGVFLITRDNVSATKAAGLELVTNGRLTKTLSYNLSTNLYWNELDAGALGFPDRRSAFSYGGRGNISWQVTPDDFVQVSGFVNARRLTAQGYIEPTGMLNLGWRHRFSDRLSGIVSVQDALGTFRHREVIDTPTLTNRIKRDFNTRFVLVGLTWTFGGGKPRDQGFDFGQGGPPS